MLDSTDAPTQATAGGITRRSVVRAGTTAAWTVPLVTVATAAPALAVSGAAALQIVGFDVRREPAKVSLWIDIDAIRNRGTGPSGQVTVTIRVPKTRQGALSAAPSLVAGPGAGWSFAGRTGSGPWDFTFVSVTGVAAKRWTKPLKFRLKLANNGATPTVNVTAVASAAGANSAAASRPMRWVPWPGGSPS